MFVFRGTPPQRLDALRAVLFRKVRCFGGRYKMRSCRGRACLQSGNWDNVVMRLVFPRLPGIPFVRKHRGAGLWKVLLFSGIVSGSQAQSPINLEAENGSRTPTLYVSTSVNEHFEQLFSVVGQLPMGTPSSHEVAAGIFAIFGFIDRKQLELGFAFDFGRGAWG